MRIRRSPRSVTEATSLNSGLSPRQVFCALGSWIWVYWSPSTPDQYGCPVAGLFSPSQVMCVPFTWYGLPAGIFRTR
jgi:hypothetical protein